MSTFDKLLVLCGLGCTALNTVAVANPKAIPLWLSLLSLFVSNGAMGLAKLTGVNVAPRTGNNAP